MILVVCVLFFVLFPILMRSFRVGRNDRNVTKLILAIVCCQPVPIWSSSWLFSQKGRQTIFFCNGRLNVNENVHLILFILCMNKREWKCTFDFVHLVHELDSTCVIVTEILNSTFSQRTTQASILHPKLDIDKTVPIGPARMASFPILSVSSLGGETHKKNLLSTFCQCHDIIIPCNVDPNISLIVKRTRKQLEQKLVCCPKLLK